MIKIFRQTYDKDLMKIYDEDVVRYMVMLMAKLFRGKNE